jgi:uncharacterized membrane protein YfcA
VTYLAQGAGMGSRLLWALLIFVPVSFCGAKIAERIVARIPKAHFRTVVAVFLALVGIQLLAFS